MVGQSEHLPYNGVSEISIIFPFLQDRQTLLEVRSDPLTTFACGIVLVCLVGSNPLSRQVYHQIQ